MPFTMKNSQISPNDSQQSTANPRSLTVQTQATMEIPLTGYGQHSERSPFDVPIQYERFAQSFAAKNNEGLFLGRTPPVSKTNRRQYSQICRVAKSEFLKGADILEPTTEALERTKHAAQDFFSLSYKWLDKQNIPFPLAGRNKCLGMVAVPTTNLVMIAISQDKNPTNDDLLRKKMVIFLNQLNETSKNWKFELACIPTKAQYLMPRTISMRTPRAASESSVKPHTRCVEVALMAALCKAGRTRNFTSADTGIIAFGGTLWANSKGSEAIAHFNVEGLARNIKYIKQDPLEVVITESLSGWIDIWEPCPEHCKIYKYEMLAIGASGGFSSSFFEPRSEGELIKKKPNPENTQVTNQILLLAVAIGAISVAICEAGIYFLAKNQNALKDKTSIAMIITGTMAITIAIATSFNLLFAANDDIASNKNNLMETDTAIVEPRSRADSCPF
jgi:hypothetical protein